MKESIQFSKYRFDFTPGPVVVEGRLIIHERLVGESCSFPDHPLTNVVIYEKDEYRTLEANLDTPARIIGKREGEIVLQYQSQGNCQLQTILHSFVAGEEATILLGSPLDDPHHNCIDSVGAPKKSIQKQSPMVMQTPGGGCQSSGANFPLISLLLLVVFCRWIWLRAHRNHL